MWLWYNWNYCHNYGYNSDCDHGCKGSIFSQFVIMTWRNLGVTTGHNKLKPFLEISDMGSAIYEVWGKSSLRFNVCGSQLALGFRHCGKDIHSIWLTKSLSYQCIKHWFASVKCLHGNENAVSLSLALHWFMQWKSVFDTTKPLILTLPNHWFSCSLWLCNKLLSDCLFHSNQVHSWVRIRSTQLWGNSPTSEGWPWMNAVKHQ